MKLDAEGNEVQPTESKVDDEQKKLEERKAKKLLRKKSLPWLWYWVRC